MHHKDEPKVEVEVEQQTSPKEEESSGGVGFFGIVLGLGILAGGAYYALKVLEKNKWW